MTYKLLLTQLGSQKIAAAATAGGTPLQITEFAVGQGVNVDFSSRLDKQVLVSKRYQAAVQGVAVVAGKANTYEITCIVPHDVGGFAIRELGLLDSSGDLIWVGALPEVQKPTADSTAAVDYRIKAVVTIDNADVTLVVDAHVVTATQSWALDRFIEKSHLNDPKAHGIDTLIKRIVALENRKIEPVKVGGLLLTTNDYKNSDEVRAGEGYGIWQRYGDGEALVALAQETNSAADFMKSIGGKGGEYTHQLTIDEMPKHVHRLAGSKWSPQNGSYPLSDEQVVLASKTIDANMRLASIHDDVLTDNYTIEPRDWASAGGNQAHNVIQKSIVIGVWVRMPELGVRYGDEVKYDGTTQYI